MSLQTPLWMIVALQKPDSVIPDDPILELTNNQCVTNHRLDLALHAYLSSISQKHHLHLIEPSMYIFPTILLMFVKVSMVL